VLNLAEFRMRPDRLVDYVPWACLVAPGIVLNKDGSLQRSLRFRGPDLDSATQAELVSVAARINNALKRFGSGWALFFEAERLPAADYPRSAFPDPVCFLVDEERRLAFEEAGAHFESQFHLTLVWLPPSQSVSAVERLFFGRGRADAPPADGQRAQDFVVDFCRRTDRAIDLLSAALPQIEPLSDAETLTYLHNCVSTKRHPIAMPAIPAYIDGLICDEPLSGGLSPRLGKRHLRNLTVLGFPPVSVPGMLDDLNRLDIAYRWVTRFIALDRVDAAALITRQRRQWFAKRKSLAALIKEVVFGEAAVLTDPDASAKAADADAALQELGEDLVSFGYVTTTLCVFDEAPQRAEEKIRLVERSINARGFATIGETLNAVEAWLGSLPGHVYANLRQPVVHTLNLVHLCPLSALWAGAARNSHLDGPPLLIARTKGATPFRLNLHVGDVGHSFVVGPTGSGKSVLLQLFAIQFRRYPESRVVIFDRGRSARAATLAQRGAWCALGEAGLSAFQPLRAIDDETERFWALDWLCGLLEHEGVAVTPESKEAIWSTLASLASAPPNERTLTGFMALLANNHLRQGLAAYTIEGPFGRFLDGDRDRLPQAAVTTFEMEELMTLPGLVSPVLTFLFHALEAQFDGSPTLLMIDEAWLFLDQPLFAQRIRAWLKTLRKRNVAVIFATQSLADIAESKIAATLIESCPTRIFLPNARALEAEQTRLYRNFGLNDAQLAIISQARPKRDYYLQSRFGNRLFELDLGPVALALVAAANAPDQALIDKVLAISGEARFAGAFLAAKGLERAAEFCRCHAELRGLEAP
jgi:type IV secretion/conjugal transfer VirB4 family ATPase